MTVNSDDVRKTVEDLLCARRVFDIDAFGWRDENNVDSEYVGYAMWVLSPPYDLDFVGWQDNVPPERAPTESQQQLMEVGHDFFGLMKTARHFIGYALLHQSAVPPIRVEPTEFDFNEFAALMSLTAATDRLRDFIIVTAIGPKKEGRYSWEAFKAAKIKLESAGFMAEANDLGREFLAIKESARKARNEATHGIATQHALVQRSLINSEREAFYNQRRPGSKQGRTYEEWVSEGERFDKLELEKVETRAKVLCNCYISLVKLGEMSFRIEHDLRAPKSI
jgi:hypothetical protein